MKKVLALVLALVMVLALAACGEKKTETPAASTPAPSTSTEQAAQPEAKKLDWPKKDISIICPFKAGGGMDLSTRLTATYLEKYLGVTVTVNNVEGGNSWTGWSQVAQAKGDGYTLGFANYPAQVAGYLNPSAGVPYTYQSYCNISNIVHDSNILVVSQKYSKYDNLKDLMEAAKTESMVLATGGGAGSDDDVLIAKINEAFGTKFESGRNASTAEGKAAMLGGHVVGAIANVSEYYSIIDSTGDDAIWILAIWDEERSDFIPDVPTAEEQGYAGVYGASDRGLIATADLDPEIEAYLIEVLKQINEDPDFKADAVKQGMGIKMIMGDDFDAYIGDIETTMKGMLALFGWA